MNSNHRYRPVPGTILMAASSENPLKCTICDKTFKRERNLMVHLQFQLCEDKRPYTCRICNKAFKIERNLIEHFRQHTDERPYKCTVCEKRTHVKETLQGISQFIRKNTIMPVLCVTSYLVAKAV